MTKKLEIFEKAENELTTCAQPKQKERTLRIPIIAVQGAALFVCLLIVVIAGSFLQYREVTQSTASGETALVMMQQNNDAQEKEIEQLARTTTSLQADLKRLNSLDAEIRSIVNNKD